MNLAMSIAMFYKREIGLEDIRAINPTAFPDTYNFRYTLKKLEEYSYIRRSGDRFQITQYGAQMLAAYESWRSLNPPKPKN